MKVFSTRLPDYLVRKLRDYCARTGRKIQHVIEMAIERYLNEKERE